ncbi:MAG: tRNA (adenosine(37)-N6)-dimethylallyltransferase MiaA [Pseudomonadota bacterium]
MADPSLSQIFDRLPPIPNAVPVLIAGPTASGKSALALRIAETLGGVVVNADASQVYRCWRVISARPTSEEENRVPHQMYGHVDHDQTYSTGHWLREVTSLLQQGPRPIIVGGTGLYFSALTEGMADIPATPPNIRADADRLDLAALITGIDAATLAQIDIRNRARVQRAWEVQQTTGRSLRSWQAETADPVLNLTDTVPIVFDTNKDWLLDRICNRFDQMMENGALSEVEAMRAHYDPTLPAFKAIGVPELMAYLDGKATLNDARERATISTRQFAKRQRTWFRARMQHWYRLDLSK